MSPKDPHSPSPPPSGRTERLAQALRENLARRKALKRARQERAGADAAPAASGRAATPDGEDDAPS